MRKIALICFVFFFSFVIQMGFSGAAELISCNPSIQIVSQDPIPALPNDYVKVVFEISNLYNCNGFSVRLNPEYPFSIDSNSTSVQTLDKEPSISGYRSVWTVPYKIRVDKDALDGEYDLKLQYHKGSSEDFTNYVEGKFNITIKDSRTDFDAVIQETSGSDVSIAIANTGKYAANSVVVRIPEQDDFSVSGTDGQMVGNLESGDYTIVGFSVGKKTPLKNATRGTSSDIQTKTSNLKFDIYYTDNLGERRVVNMELPLKTGNSTAYSGAGRSTTASTSSSSTKWYILLILLIIGTGGYFAYRKSSKIKEFLKREKIEVGKEVKSIEKVPEWVRKVVEKEKRK